MVKSTSLTLSWRQINKSHQRALGQKCFKLVKHLQRNRPVPPLFAIPKKVVSGILETNRVHADLRKSVLEQVAELEKDTGMKFGGEKEPLFLAVRSGDPRSMYGSLLTVLPIGMNDRTYPGLIEKYGPESETGVLWSYLNLIVDFAVHLRGIKRERIQPLLDEMKEGNKSADDLRRLIHQAQNLRTFYKVKFSFPQDPQTQLMEAIRAVAFSWNSTKAKCAAAALRLGPKELLSVFVQKMVFTSLTMDSGFMSLSTNPGPEGSFARKTTGARIMFGLAKDVISLGELKNEHPDIHAKIWPKIWPHIDAITREERDVLTFEIPIAPGWKPWISQITPAALSPVRHVEAINDMVRKGIISYADATRKMADVQIEQEIKMYRIADDAVMELLAKGKPGSPGAMAGRLALTVEQALQFKKRKEGVILLTTEPQDENVYLLTLGHNIDGIMATYGIGRGSHIADFSQANGIPMVASLRGVKLQKNAMVIGGKKIRVGDPILIEGNKGMVYLTEESDPIVEDKTVVSSSYGINFLEQMRSVRTRFAAKTYDEVLAEHAEGTKYLKELLDGKQSREAIVGIQARIHCLHRLAYEKGKLLKKNEIQVDLDVAVADGNLDRIPGLEDKEFYFDKTLDKTGEEYFLIMGTELEYESDMIQDGGIPLKDVHELVEAIRGGDLKAEYYYRSRKITMHRQHLSTFGIRFHKDEYSRVVEFLKDYFLASNGVNKK